MNVTLQHYILSKSAKSTEIIFLADSLLIIQFYNLTVIAVLETPTCATKPATRHRNRGLPCTAADSSGLSKCAAQRCTALL